MAGMSLYETFERVTDPRDPSGKRFPLPGILSIVVAAILAGRKSMAAVSRWGRCLTRRQLRELSIDRPKAPCQAAYHNVLKRLPVAEFESALGDWARSALGDEAPGAVSMDGKSLRGSAFSDYPAVHLLSLWCERARGVLGEVRVDEGGNEITAARELLARTDLAGMVLTGDAIFAQRDLCAAIVEGGGDYVMAVKANQPALAEAIEEAFAEPVSPSGETAVGRGG